MSMFENSSHHQSLHQQNEQHDEYRRGHEHIAKNLADLMRAGKEISDPDVQFWIGKHYEFILQFWTPNRIAYKSLALTYVMDPAFKATYEAFEPGLAKYIQTAINIWADVNLQ
jgi:TipAS antibiotic-recognition domain